MGGRPVGSEPPPTFCQGWLAQQLQERAPTLKPPPSSCLAWLPSLGRGIRGAEAPKIHAPLKSPLALKKNPRQHLPGEQTGGLALPGTAVPRGGRTDQGPEHGALAAQDRAHVAESLPVATGTTWPEWPFHGQWEAS